MRVQSVQKVQRVQRGRLTGLRPEGCGRLSAAGYVRFAQGATALRAEGCGIAPWAMSIKSALRDWLSMSYSMKSILLIGSLRSPPYPASPDFPLFRGRIKHLEASLRKRLYSKHGLLCHLEEGERWWRQPPKGDCISSPAWRLYGLSSGESPVVKVLS